MEDDLGDGQSILAEAVHAKRLGGERVEPNGPLPSGIASGRTVAVPLGLGSDGCPQDAPRFAMSVSSGFRKELVSLVPDDVSIASEIA